MPLYEYQCDSCGSVFEVIQKFADQPLTSHDNCGGPVRRLLSPPALQFKGSGWYITDYAKGKDTSSSKPSGESKPESKPAATTPSSTAGASSDSK